MAAHHSTQASPASGSPWVSAETPSAASLSAASSPRCASATGAVRMRLPLPAAPLGLRRKCSLASAVSSPALPARERTALVWMPTSVGPPRNHARKASPIRSRAVDPSAVTCAMHTAIWVSSVHWPGFQPKPPPPIIPIAASAPGCVNS